MEQATKKKIIRTLRKTVKFFAFVFIVSFVVWRWDAISWVFDYNGLPGLVYKYTGAFQNTDAAYKSDLEIEASAAPQIKYVYTDQKNLLEIPALDVSATIAFPKTPDQSIISAKLDRGNVVFYPGSVMPGDNGPIVILGHSAPLSWPKMKNVGVFTHLSDLKPGDKVYISLDNKKFTYIVQDSKIIEGGQEMDPTLLTNSGNVVLLVSCWPPGKNLQRIVVQANLSIN
jgi:LPXTG-site transpeptidase (sortase) family protein